MTASETRPQLVSILLSPEDVPSCCELLGKLPARLTVVLLGLETDVSAPLPSPWSFKKLSSGHERRLTAGCVYRLPRDQRWKLDDGRIRPDEESQEKDSTASFLRSVAAEQHGDAVTIVLGGDTAEGLDGLRALHEECALLLTQPVDGSGRPELVRQCSSLGYVDFTLPLDRMAAELARVLETAAPDAAAAGLDETLPSVLSIIRRSTGVDLSQYKQMTVRRRTTRRMMLRRIETAEAYLRLLEQDEREVEALYDDLLIGVTQFFRDAEVFETLKDVTLPSLVEAHTSDSPLRMWVPGCSTGEEAYSLAIVVLECLAQHALNIPVHVFATDVNERSLARARAGLYPASIEHYVSAERLSRFFVKVDSHYRISKMVRDVCIFARQDLLRDPPFSKLDLLSCRNVLIYMGPALQQRIMTTFHYALKPTGYLLLGSSESIGRYADLFALIDRRHKLYAKKPVQAQPRELKLGDASSPREAGLMPAHDADRYDPGRDADRLLMARYAPPAVLVNNRWEIVQYRGRTGRFLEAAPGAATLNLLKQLRPGLLHEVRTALQQAHQSGEAVSREALSLQDQDGARQVKVEVIPVKGPHLIDPFFLVTFSDVPTLSPAPTVSQDVDQQVNALQRELTLSKDYMQSIIQEQESTNDELNSLNEEVQAANEELQSTNEELETAKEELQSTNEELTTVNEELFDRNSELTRVNDDLQNLFASVNLPILMLDPELRIRRFTPQATKIFNVISSDVGRPIREIRANLEIPHLEEILRDVIENLAIVETPVQQGDGPRYSLRVRPYQTFDHKIDGAVLVLVDLPTP